MMDVPESLPARLFLLAYDLRKQRMTARMERGLILRAAALNTLLREEYLTDDGGSPRALRDTHPDPVLSEVLQQIGASRPRRWQHWVARGERQTYWAVSDQLMAGGWIRVERRHVLGIFPVASVTVREPRVVKNLHAQIAAALRQPASRVAPDVAAMVALAATGGLSTALNRSLRREHKERIAALAESTGPVAQALRKAIQAAQASAV
jgi:hypothetical protein